MGRLNQSSAPSRDKTKHLHELLDNHLIPPIHCNRKWKTQPTIFPTELGIYRFLNILNILVHNLLGCIYRCLYTCVYKTYKLRYIYNTESLGLERPPGSSNPVFDQSPPCQRDRSTVKETGATLSFLEYTSRDGVSNISLGSPFQSLITLLWRNSSQCPAGTSPAAVRGH